MNKHPYMDAMVANVDAFKELTGMDVKYDVFPEDVYFDKVQAALSSGSTEYDVFMTGAYQTWQYGPAGWLVDMNEFIWRRQPDRPTYNWEDILPNLRSSTAWSGVPGAELGGEGAKQWAVPWGFELNSVAYNKRVFDQLGMTPPENMDDMIEKAARIKAEADGMYGIGVRGSRSWATIHPGFLSAYSNFGQRDFTMEDGKLMAAMGTAESKAFHAQWVKMIQDSGAADWSSHTWYQVGTDLGSGASGMIYDADILGLLHERCRQCRGRQHRLFGLHAQPGSRGTDAECLDLVVGHVQLLDPGRKPPGITSSGPPPASTACSARRRWTSSTRCVSRSGTTPDFKRPDRQKSYPGYLEQFQYEASAPGSKIYFTPQPLFAL